MVEKVDEKLIAMASRIARSLAIAGDMTDDDILKFFSNFDGRLREKLTEKLSDDGVEQTLNSLDRQISRYLAYEASIWLNFVDSAAFLAAADQLITAVRDWTPLANDKSISSCLDRTEDLLQ